ncbi:MAG: hypothetical protein E6Q97_36740 [Desulfurellales bacterium]|nr:MAG: hypothetical protein E6Q97_36740 [Desulfurellales bacterium]
MTPRETIFVTLFDLVASVTGLKSYSRRLKHWGDVPHTDQPALFLVQRTESAKITTKLPTVWTFRADLVLYGHNSGQDSVAPMSSLNPIVDEIVAKLLPAGGVEEQTLGGLVERCRIEGEILTDEGALGDQAIVVIPLTLFVPQ